MKIKMPLVVESNLSGMKSKDVIALLKATLGSLSSLALKNKEVRAGKGKRRGRKYKSNAGLLIVTGSEEKFTMKGLDVIPLRELSILDLYPLGRLTAWGKKYNVLVIDPTSAMQEAAKYEQVYWNKDVHCTQAGYRVIAETVYAKLTELRIAP